MSCILCRGLLVFVLLTGSVLAQPAGSTSLLVPDAQAYEQLGWSIAVDGSRVAIGARLSDGSDFNTGAIYVFEEDGGAWSLTDRVEADVPLLNDNLGESLALRNDRIVAGTAHNVGPIEAVGSAYVFERRREGWVEVALLEPEFPQFGQRFGFAVATAGDTVVVGAPGEQGAAWKEGAVYVYVEGLSGWELVQRLVPDGDATTRQFGFDLSLQGDRLVVGALWDSANGPASGSAYVFARARDGTWVQEAELVAPDGGPADEFGTAVAFDGRRVAIGSPGDDDGAFASGAVYVYERFADQWLFTSKIVPTDAEYDDYFGRRLALQGDLLAVGSMNIDGLFANGAVRMFREVDGEWRYVARLDAQPGTSLGSELGSSVALAGHVLVAGAFLDDEAAVDGGSATVLDVEELP